MNYWIIEPCSKYWIIELLNRVQIIELLNYWTGVSIYWNIELLNRVQYIGIIEIIEYWFNILKLLKMFHSICHVILNILNYWTSMLIYWNIELLNPVQYISNYWNIEFNNFNILNRNSIISIFSIYWTTFNNSIIQYFAQIIESIFNNSIIQQFNILNEDVTIQ